MADRPADRWRALAAIALAQVGAMSTWFSAAAVAILQSWLDSRRGAAIDTRRPAAPTLEE